MAITLRQRAYEHIRRKLQRGELSAGSRLEEPSLASEIGVSRAPVREAIRQLESEGLVSQVPRLGAFVKVPTRRDIRQWCELREALECYAAAKVAVEARDEAVARIVEVHRHMLRLARSIRGRRITDLSRQTPCGRDWSHADVAFHMAIMSAADNEDAARQVSNLHIIKMFSDIPVEPAHRMVARVCREHGRILRAIRRNDADGARQVMAAHVAKAKQGMLYDYDSRSLRTNFWSDLGLYSDGAV